MSSPSRLFFCSTPLQSLIIAQIQAISPGRDTIVYLPHSASFKHKIYYDRLVAHTKVLIDYSFASGSSFLTDQIKMYYRIPRKIRHHNYEYMYVGSTTSLPFSWLLIKNPSTSLNTFDDGTCNVIPEMFRAQLMEAEGFFDILLRKIRGASSSAEIIKRSRCHFTIYEKDRCLVPADQVRQVHIFGSKNFLSAEPREKVDVVIGTAIDYNKIKTNKILYERTLSRINPPIFISHPMEKRKSYVKRESGLDDEIERFIDRAIAEDVIAALIERGYQPHVYGFGSTALLNLSGLVDTTNIVLEGVSDAEQDLFASFGIANVRADALIGAAAEKCQSRSGDGATPKSFEEET